MASDRVSRSGTPRSRRIPYRLKRLYRPEFYQGPRRRLTTYFEGWYYKLVGVGRAFALIPGVSRAPDDPHSFVQLIDGIAGSSAYHRYPLQSFLADRDRFRVAVGGSSFSLEHLEARLDGFEANLRFDRPTLWRGTLLQPGTMGWYSFVPFMECKHGIIVMDAAARGTVCGEPWEGRLYVEKDYGRSFPNAWVWLQTNSFDSTGVSVTCSIANVPFVGGAFTGFLAGISVDGELFKFTTYAGSRIERLDVLDRSVDIELAGPHDRRLRISATREPGAELRSPRDGAMRGRIVETLSSRVDVKLESQGRLIFEGTGRSAGLEVVGADRLTPRRPRRR